jgi:hypothetical protein
MNTNNSTIEYNIEPHHIRRYDPFFGYREKLTITFSQYNNFTLDAVLVNVFDLPYSIQDIVRKENCVYAWVSKDWFISEMFEQKKINLCIKNCPKVNFVEPKFNFVESEPDKTIYPFIFASDKWWDEMSFVISHKIKYS